MGVEWYIPGDLCWQSLQRGKVSSTPQQQASFQDSQLCMANFAQPKQSEYMRGIKPTKSSNSIDIPCWKWSWIWLATPTKDTIYRIQGFKIVFLYGCISNMTQFWLKKKANIWIMINKYHIMSNTNWRNLNIH